MLQVVEINRIDELHRYAQAWEALLSATPGGSFFQSLSWLAHYWNHFGSDKQLRVLVVLDDGEPVGIVPMVVVEESTRAGRVRVLTYPLASWGTHYGPIGPDPQATLAAALAHVRRTVKSWDLLDLRWVADDPIQRDDHAGAFGQAGLSCLRSVWAETALVDLSGTWEAYLGSRSAKFRANIRRLERRLDEQGEIRHERFRPSVSEAAASDDDTLRRPFEICEQLAHRSWQDSRSDGTTLSHESVKQYLHDTHLAAAREGAVDVNILWLGDRPLAFAYNYHGGGNVYGLRTGYAPEMARFSPGAILFSRMFRDGFERGDHTFDLGPEYRNAKRSWMTHAAAIHRFTHYPLTRPRAQILRMKHVLRKRLGTTSA